MDVPCPIRWDAYVWGLLTGWLKKQDFYSTKEVLKQSAGKNGKQGSSPRIFPGLWLLYFACAHLRAEFSK